MMILTRVVVGKGVRWRACCMTRMERRRALLLVARMAGIARLHSSCELGYLPGWHLGWGSIVWVTIEMQERAWWWRRDAKEVRDAGWLDYVGNRLVRRVWRGDSMARDWGMVMRRVVRVVGCVLVGLMVA